MAREDTQNETIDTEKIKQAIVDLRNRGADINPYSVARQAEISEEMIIENSRLFDLIVEARGGGIGFRDPDTILREKAEELDKRVIELEHDNTELINRIADLENRLEQIEYPEEGEGSRQLKEMESELESAYAQLVQSQEDKTELEHSVTGLERVNEALNFRLRELEDEIRKHKSEYEQLESKLQDKQSDNSPNKTKDSTTAELEISNSQHSEDKESKKKIEILSERLEELSQESTMQKARISELEQSSTEWRLKSEEAEVRLGELQEEAENLAAQLQTAWNIAYQQRNAAQSLAQDISLEQSEKAARSDHRQSLENPLSDSEEPDSHPPLLANRNSIEDETTDELGAITQVEATDEPESPDPDAEDLDTAEIGVSAHDKEEKIAQIAAENLHSENSAPEISRPRGIVKQKADYVLDFGSYSDDEQVSGESEFADSLSSPEPEPEPEIIANLPDKSAYQPESPRYDDPNKVYNFAKPNAYVASEFNPLESLSWRELETVYSMGVLSIKDFASQLPSGKQDPQQTNAPEPKSVENNKAEQTTKSGSKESSKEVPARQEAHQEDRQEARQEDRQEARQENRQENRLDSEPAANELDFDNMDIFEDLEELEDLNNLDWPKDNLADLLPRAQEGEPLDKEEKGSISIDQNNAPETQSPISNPEQEAAAPSGEALRDLIKARIAQAKTKDHSEFGESPERDVELEQDAGTSQEATSAQNAGAVARSSLANKFVGGRGPKAEPPPQVDEAQQRLLKVKHLPADVRKYCMFLGIRPSDMTRELVLKEWKRQISDPRVHPDLGGDKELATDLNMAKDTLLKWLDENEPKLGKKFGGSSSKELSSRFTSRSRQTDKS